MHADLNAFSQLSDVPQQRLGRWIRHGGFKRLPLLKKAGNLKVVEDGVSVPVDCADVGEPSICGVGQYAVKEVGRIDDVARFFATEFIRDEHAYTHVPESMPEPGLAAALFGARDGAVGADLGGGLVADLDA